MERGQGEARMRGEKRRAAKERRRGSGEEREGGGIVDLPWPLRRSPQGLTSLRLPVVVSPLLYLGVARSRLLPLVTVNPYLSNLQRSVWLLLRR